MGELWLGSDESTLQLIASGRWSAEWDVSPTSAPQRLEEGSCYLVRAIVYNNNGQGGVAVGVTLPDGEVLRPMPVLGYLFEPPPTIYGCTNPTATNFNPWAEFDDSSCIGGRVVGAKLDIWEGISGAAVSDLTSNPAYLADTPTSTEVLTTGAVLETEAGGDNDAAVVVLFLALNLPWLNSCGAYASIYEASALTGCDAHVIRRSANCDPGCQRDPEYLKRICPDTCGVNDNLGSRLTAYFRAPQTGDYTFVIVADDTGELWLGS